MYNPWNKGKKLSEEHKRKIGLASKGRKQTENAKKKLSEIHKGQNNVNWKGEKVSYKGLHNWINSNKPKPKLCEICELVPPYDAANISGKYLRDLDDWIYICRSCHVKSDKRILNLKQYSGMSSCAIA